MRGIDTRVPAQRLLVGAGMRRAVGAEEEFRIAARRRAHERLAMLLALQHRQAVVVRPDAAREHRAAIVEQVVRGDRGGDPGTACQDEFHRFAGGRVLDHDPQPREAARDAGEHRFEEHALAVENVHAGRRDFAVDEQRQIVFLHRSERGIGALDPRDAGLRVRRCARRVVLHPAHEARLLRARDLLRAGVVGQVHGHEGLEVGSLRQRIQYAAAVGGGARRVGDRGREIRHDHGAREHSSSVGKHARERGAVAKVQVSVVRPGEGQGLHGIRIAGRSQRARTAGRARIPRSSSLR